MSLNPFFYRGLCLSTALFTTLSFSATNIDSKLLPGFNSIQTTTIKKEITYLASDSLQGRRTLKSGDDKAIQWIASQFKTIGLKPAVGESYLQPVELIGYTPDAKQSYLQLNRGTESIRWKKPDVFSSFNRDMHLSSEVVFAGYGITAPDLNYDDYQQVDVTGKIVLVFEHEPQEQNEKSIFNGKSNTIYATNRIKALNAQKHGAMAILIAPEPNRKHPSNQERYMRIYGKHEKTNQAQSLALANDELHIPIAVISDAVAKTIAGHEISLSQLQSTIDQNLKPQSRALTKARMTIENKNRSRTTGISYNVAGILEGSDPALKNETILISAHHDHDGMNKKKIWRGADDNASGTAGVITLANAYMKNSQSPAGMTPKRSLLFVVFTAEEAGLLGSFYMAAHPLRPLATTRAMLNFDMIGRNEKASAQTKGIIPIPADTTNRLNIIGAHYSPDYKKTMLQQNQWIGLTMDERFDNEPVLNVLFRSDQFPFMLHQVPAFWWFTGFHPDYHQTTDSADKINYAKMQKILRLAYLTGFAFANEKTTPQFITNPAPV